VSIIANLENITKKVINPDSLAILLPLGLNSALDGDVLHPHSFRFDFAKGWVKWVVQQ
jgi:hypothetical protein